VRRRLQDLTLSLRNEAYAHRLTNELACPGNNFLSIDKCRFAALRLSNTLANLLEPSRLDLLRCAFLFGGELSFQDVEQLAPLFGRELASLFDDGAYTMVHG